MRPVWRMPMRLQFGSGASLPGYRNDVSVEWVKNEVDHIYVRHYLEFYSEAFGRGFLRAALGALLPDGRIDVRVPDALELCAAYADEAARSRVEVALAGSRTLFWDERLGAWMKDAGFERLERIKESPGIHLIGFKPKAVSE